MKIRRLLCMLLLLSANSFAAQSRRLSRNEIHQLFRCIFKFDEPSNVKTVTFRYLVLPPNKKIPDATEEVDLVLYENKRQTRGILVQYFINRRGKCQEYEKGNDGTFFFNKFGDMDMEEMWTGGIGTQEMFLKRIHQMYRFPAISISRTEIPRTCVKCKPQRV
jgi:hypothetical protein